MNLYTYAFGAARILAIVTFIAAWFLSSRSESDREKTSPFECGFDPKNTARIPFSLRFFLLGIIFIVFDIEIVLIMPLPILSNTLPLLSAYSTATIFLLILILGLLHE
jgi:NADH-ubiquinone oxidoreductase chain 3